MRLLKIKSVVINLDSVAYWEAVPTADHWNPPKRSSDPLARPATEALYPRILYDETGDVFVSIYFVGTAAPLRLDTAASRAFLEYVAAKCHMEPIQVAGSATPGA
jgi:hypothetical protein